MTQQNLRELLKQGDPKAIASSINRTLKPKGINAEVTRDNGCLHIILESDKVPSQMALVDFIRNGMTNLGVESIYTVKIYGRRTGDDSPAWEDEIDLMPAEPMLYTDEGSMPDDSVGLDDDDDDVDTEGGDYYDEAEFDRDEEDEDEDADEEEEEVPPPKKQFPKWAIPVGILVPVAAIAGLFLTNNLPFLSSSTSESSAPVATSPSPKASSPASKAASSSPGAKPANSPSAATAKPATPDSGASGAPKAAPPSPASQAASPAPKAAAPKSDPWREAVNKAQSAAVLAQTAQSQNEWIAVASEWQKAVGLMRTVPATSPNYQKAQQKAAEYQANLVVANRRAAAAP
ncbi:MAG: hypothetical protein HC789_22405 [Microcoleus sp. CSU_2_2]|nr:hypothetical protein [Microcoleus sp. SU_5_3]NJS12920.1 hypothetical protein [Microcoleus sp. CSU_2_2]